LLRPLNAPNFSTRFFKFGKEQRFDYDPEKRIDYFSLPMAKYFSRFAKFAYCHVQDIESFRGVCPSILAGGAWGTNRIDDKVKIIISEKYKKVIFTCAGEPKRMWNFPGNLMSSRFKPLFKKEPGVKVFEYFKDIQDDPFTNLTIMPNFKSIQNYYPDYQLIFLGHSLGGSICNLLAFEAVKTNLIKKTKDSPVLITYGQPITGNDEFIKDTKKFIPLIFRIVRNEDAAPTFPRKEAKPDDYINPKVYPKDIGDFYAIDKNSDKFTFCTIDESMTSSADNEECKVRTTYNSYNHKFYLHDNLSDIDPLTEYNKSVPNLKQKLN
jgi:hypothetical protein